MATGKLFSEDWLDLQTTFAQVSRLPSDKKSFTDRYGEFKDQQGDQEFVAALANVDDIAKTFGNPDSVKNKITTDGKYLLQADPPEGVYAHLIWLAIQIQNSANTFIYTLSSLKDLLKNLAGAGGSASESAENLKIMLSGEGGLMDDASAVRSKIQSLINELAQYETRLAKNIKTFNSTKLLNEASQTIGGLEADIDEMQKEAEAAYQRWKGKALSPTEATDPIHIGGGEQEGGFVWPWNRRKEKAHKKYDDLVTRISAEEAEVKQKAQFVGDLKGFFIASNRVVPAVQDLQTTLAGIEKAFTKVAERMQSVVTSANTEQLGDYEWLSRAMEIPDSLEKMQAIADSVSGFAQNALVSFDTSSG